MAADPDAVFGPKVHEAPAGEAAAPRLKQSELRPLADIQADLRADTSRRLRGQFRKGRQV